MLLTLVASPAPGQNGGGFTSFLKELFPAGAARGPVQQEVTHGQGNLLPRSTASPETSPSGRASLGQPKGCVLV